MIRADDRVASVLKRDEGLVDVFTSVSPAFEALRKPALRRTMARMVTVAQAAKIAKVDVDLLLSRLNGASSEAAPSAADSNSEPSAAEPVPAHLQTLPAERIVELDVRPDLREGREPLRKILDTVRTVRDGQIFRLRAIFEPAPLYRVLGKQGFGYFTERIADDDWRIWFYRDEMEAKAAAAGQVSEPAPEVEEDEIVVLDVRALEPPEPMVQTLEALAALPKGKTLLQINQRVPQFLLPKLQERGFSYEIREQSESLVRIFIRHRAEGP